MSLEKIGNFIYSVLDWMSWVGGIMFFIMFIVAMCFGSLELSFADL